MAKRKKNKEPEVVNVTPTYTVGQKLILSDEKTMMDKCTIDKIEETEYVLSNGVKVNFDLRRNDGKQGHCFIHDQEGEERFQAYFAQMVICRVLPELAKEVEKFDKMNLTQDEVKTILKINRLTNKIKNTLNRNSND